MLSLFEFKPTITRIWGTSSPVSRPHTYWCRQLHTISVESSWQKTGSPCVVLLINRRHAFLSFSEHRKLHSDFTYSSSVISALISFQFIGAFPSAVFYVKDEAGLPLVIEHYSWALHLTYYVLWLLDSAFQFSSLLFSFLLYPAVTTVLYTVHVYFVTQLSGIV